MPETIQATVPGSLMLFGEHAVLQGRLAIACAVSPRMRVRLTPRSDTRIYILSDLGRYETELDHFAPDPRFRFVLTAVGRYLALLERGFDLRIESEFPPDLGLGSSAAVTVGTLAVLHARTGGERNRDQLAQEARGVIREVQGLGSGADAAASLFGGIVSYRMEPLSIRRLPERHPLTVVYSGRKTPTAEVVSRVESARARFPEIYAALFDAMERVAVRAQEAILAEDWTRVGELMNVGQGLLDALGVNDDRLQAIVQALRACPGILGAKISGSGLGDCAVGLGTAGETSVPGRPVPLEIAEEGLTLG